MADPVVNDSLNEQKKATTMAGQVWSSWVFGWGEDVFDNEELFHPINGEDRKQKIEIDENLNLDIDENEIINDEEVFDPIFTDEDKIENLENEETKKIEENEILKWEVVEKNEIINNDKWNKEITVENSDEEGIKEEIIEDSNEEEVSEWVKEEIPVAENPQSASQPAPLEKESDTGTTIEKEKESEDEKSDLMKKFWELVDKSKQLYEVAQMEDGEYVELVWWNTGTAQIVYNFRLIQEDDENSSILISKIETNTESGDQEQNNLQFKNNDWSIEILLDEQLLYDEIEDLQDDQNKKMQVMDKLNKFIFLISEELKIYERDRKEKERMEQERRKLRDIFRNF